MNMEKGLAPVVVFAYNRPDCLKRAAQALCSDSLAKKTEVFIFIDGCKKESDREKVAGCVDLACSLKNSDSLGRVEVSVSETNRGLAQSIISGVTKVIGEYKRVIVLEDDLVVRGAFLRYMNDALRYYEEDGEIWSISGFTPYLRRLKRYPEDVYYSYRGCSWGWATWEDRFKLVDWQVSTYGDFKKNESLRRQFARGGGDLPGMLDKQMNKEIDSWAVRWCYEQSLRNMYTIYPSRTFIENTGFGEDATHTKKQNMRTAPVNEKDSLKFIKSGPDPAITREFYLYYTDTVSKKIRRNLNPEGIKKQLGRLFGK